MFEDFVALPVRALCPASSFITMETLWINEAIDAVLSVCHFDTARYDVGMFSGLNLKMPDELKMAVRKRQAEFLAGRCMADLALKTLGQEGKIAGVVIGRDRCPQWPEGISGSISHTNHIAIAVVRKWRATFPFTGIDVEPVMDLRIAATVEKDVCCYDELRALQSLGYPDNILISLIFSAKEALFKATYPKVGKYFDFDCVTVCGVCSQAQTLDLRFTRHFAEDTGIHQVFRCFFNIEPHQVTTLIVD